MQGSKNLADTTNQIHEVQLIPSKGTFNLLSSEDWSSLLEKAERRVMDHNDIILRQGHIGEAIYIVAEGEVRIEREGNGTRVPIARLETGSVFGEMSFFDKAAASADFVADSEVEILCVEGADIRALMEDDPGFATRFFHSLATTLSRRLRITNQVVQSLS